MTAILGISAFYHDSAAALVVDGEIVAAAQEERFSRKKNDEAFPAEAVRYCLEESGLRVEDVDHVAFYDKPLLKFERLLETYLAFAPRGFASFARAMPKWLGGKMRTARELSRGLGGRYRRRFVFTEHHESHAASAFFPSPFEEAAVLTLDGVGEWATASYGVGRGNELSLTHELHFPHSIGLLYSAFTYYGGFKVNEGEYKLMGLAPYGEPTYVDTILEHIVDVKADGSIRLDLSYFDYCAGLTMTSEKFHRLFGGPPRQPHAPLTQRDMDIAASIQRVTEEIMLRAARHVHEQTGLKNLCLAGGVALNCVGNGRILREGPFENVWVQPAAGDAGGALGSALFVWHQLLGKERRPRATDSEHGALLGPSFDDRRIAAFLDRAGVVHERFDSDQALCDHVAGLLADGRVVGWFQGRMEFGPRALGSRSILADPRRLDMQSTINLKVKFREGFRPFAPAVLRDRASDYFEVDPRVDSPYMLMVCPVKQERRTPMNGGAKGLDRLKHPRSEVQAVTHVDYSARIQTVDPERHGIYHTLLEAFHRRTGCPVLVNTSYNLGWEPIVCTPEEAYATFMSSDIDALCLGKAVLLKERQRAWVESRESADGADGRARRAGADPVLAPLLASPCAPGAELRPTGPAGSGYACAQTGTEFAVDDGVPLLFWPAGRPGAAADAEVARAARAALRALCEEAPAPDYGKTDARHSLLEWAKRDGAAKELYQGLPFDSTVLEVGCGSGQLANLLAISTRRVVGTDLCERSLRTAERFRREQGLDRARFVQMNPMRPCFRPGRFDVLICNLARVSDVARLAPEADARHALLSLVPLVRPDGYVIAGAYGVDPADRRRAREVRRAVLGVRRLLGWLEEAGLEFVRSLPALAPDRDAARRLLDPAPAGSAVDHLMFVAEQLFAGGRGEGLFVIGRRRAAAVVPEAAKREVHVEPLRAE